MESGLKLASCPFCGGESEIIIDTDDDGRFAAVACPKCGAGSRKHYFCGDDARDYAASAWNTRAPSDAALVEALEDVTAHLAAAISLLSRSPKTGAASNKMFDQMLVDYDNSAARGRAALAAAKGQQP